MNFAPFGSIASLPLAQQRYFNQVYMTNLIHPMIIDKHE